MRSLFLLVSAALCAVACSGNTSPDVKPTDAGHAPARLKTAIVYVDSSMPLADLESVFHGLESWHDALPDLVDFPDVRVVPRDTALAAERGISIVAANGLEDKECWVGSGTIARTFWDPGAPNWRATECFVAGEYGGLEPWMVHAHEIGHAMGLLHSDDPLDVMHNPPGNGPREVDRDEIEKAVREMGDRAR